MATLRIPYIEIKERAHRHRFTWPYEPAIPHEADRNTKRGELCRSHTILFELYPNYPEQFVNSILAAPKLPKAARINPSENPDGQQGNPP
ncbi:MAG: hypothetical protein WBM02_02450 [bacterium]